VAAELSALAACRASVRRCANAQALLDLYGHVDRDGDGWRDQPDGAPLVLEYNRLFQRQRVLPDGPERLAVIRRIKEITVATMPYDAHVHRIRTDLAQPWVVGYHRNVFLREYWRYVDIDLAEKARRLR